MAAAPSFLFSKLGKRALCSLGTWSGVEEAVPHPFPRPGSEEGVGSFLLCSIPLGDWEEWRSCCSPCLSQTKSIPIW